MLIVKRVLLASLLTSVAALSPELAVVPPTGFGIVCVPPEVRRIVGSMRLVDIPHRWRKRNWIGDRGQGSCVHAALVHLWHWQGRHDLAEWWAARHGNGETAE